MRVSASELRHYRTAIASGRLHPYAAPYGSPIYASQANAPLESIGSLVSGALPRHPPPYTCSLCGRTGLKSWTAATQHVSARHTADFMKTIDAHDVERAVSTHTLAFTPLSASADSIFENALVRIVNALTLDEAIELATDALLGRTENDACVVSP